MKHGARFFLVLISLFSIHARADASGTGAARLDIAGDLMVHPDQIADFFTLATDKIASSAGWDWPAMQFVKPYRTSWSDVRALGPFQMKFSTADLKNQEIGFELEWPNPTVSIGRFEINDTITRDVGGAHIIIHLNGQCSGMTMNIPSGDWKVKGRLAWNWVSGLPEIKWLDFQFDMNSAAVPTAEWGECQGPSGLVPSLQEAFDGIVHDQSWLRDVLRDGVLDWVRSSFTGLQAELMKSRVLPVKAGLDLTWRPEAVSGLPGGVVRVAGSLLLEKRDTPVKIDRRLARGVDESDLAAVKESGFVLPKDTLTAALDFLYRTGELGYRVRSDQVDSFQSLMQSRFLQFFVWPDLMSFAKSTLFYFDLGLSRTPSLSNGYMLNGGGVAYHIEAPLLVRQWAPAGAAYLPYADFTSPLSGSLRASVQDGRLDLSLQPDNMGINVLFRPEFSAVRPVTAWIATSLLGSSVREYLTSRPMSVDLPSWPLGPDMALTIRDVQAWRQSFRVPLEFRNSK